MRWCGLLLACDTLELQADYSRYSGAHISASLTLPLARWAAVLHKAGCCTLQGSSAADSAPLHAPSASQRPQHNLAAAAAQQQQQQQQHLPATAWRAWRELPLNAACSQVTHQTADVPLPMARSMGKGLILKVAAYMRPKCHALLLDDSINSPTTVRLNIYQVCGGGTLGAALAPG